MIVYLGSKEYLGSGSRISSRKQIECFWHNFKTFIRMLEWPAINLQNDIMAWNFRDCTLSVHFHFYFPLQKKFQRHTKLSLLENVLFSIYLNVHKRKQFSMGGYPPFPKGKNEYVHIQPSVLSMKGLVFCSRF